MRRRNHRRATDLRVRRLAPSRLGSVSYRHRFGLAPGDPALDEIERRIALQPPIAVPTISRHGTDAGIRPAKAEDPDAGRFTGPYERRVLGGVGHSIPGEAPAAVIQALRDLLRA